MKNLHEKDTPEWELFEEAERLADMTATDSEVADALDRMTVAIYRVGSLLVKHQSDSSYELHQIAFSIESIKDELDSN